VTLMTFDTAVERPSNRSRIVVILTALRTFLEIHMIATS